MKKSNRFSPEVSGRAVRMVPRPWRSHDRTMSFVVVLSLRPVNRTIRGTLVEWARQHAVAQSIMTCQSCNMRGHFEK